MRAVQLSGSSSWLLLFMGCGACTRMFFNTGVASAFGVTPSSSSSSRAVSTFLSMASPLADEALACYPYVFRASANAEKRTMMDITKQQALTTFEELARLYGDERAVGMVKVQPLVLGLANPDYFEPTFNTWSEIFGVDQTQAMVARNPNLLLVSPKSAESDAIGAMGWSFVLWATRPVLAKVALAGYLFYSYSSTMNSAEGLPDWIQHASDGL